VVGGAVQNAMHVTSAFRGHLTCNSLGDFTAVSRGAGARSITVASNYAGTMTITGSTAVGSLTLGGVSDSVTVNPDVGNGGVTINGDVSGTLDLVGFSSSSSGGVTISGAITSTGNVITRKSVSQFVRVGGDIDGTLDIRRDVTSAPREVRCFGNVAGSVDFDDIGPFVALIGEPCTTCGGDSMMLSGDGDGDSDWLRDPRVLAAQLRASVSAERMNTLIDAVMALAANPPDGSTIPWDLVLVELLD